MPFYIENTFPSAGAGRLRQGGRIERCLTFGPVRLAPGRGRVLAEALFGDYRGAIAQYHREQRCRLWAVSDIGTRLHEVGPEGLPLGAQPTEELPPVMDEAPEVSITRNPDIAHSDDCLDQMDQGHGCSCWQEQKATERTMSFEAKLAAEAGDAVDETIFADLNAVEPTPLSEPLEVPDLSYAATLAKLKERKRPDLEQILRELKRSYSKADDKDALARKILGPESEDA